MAFCLAPQSRSVSGERGAQSDARPAGLLEDVDRCGLSFGSVPTSFHPDVPLIQEPAKRVLLSMSVYVSGSRVLHPGLVGQWSQLVERETTEKLDHDEREMKMEMALFLSLSVYVSGSRVLHPGLVGQWSQLVERETTEKLDHDEREMKMEMALCRMLNHE